jgi:hypothetical protein
VITATDLALFALIMFGTVLACSALLLAVLSIGGRVVEDAHAEIEIDGTDQISPEALARIQARVADELTARRQEKEIPW